MKIAGMQVMRGLSLWSTTQPKLIVLSLDTKTGSLPEPELALLYKRGAQYVPKGPYTSIAILTERLIKLLLDSAQMPCLYSRVEAGEEGLQRIIFSYTLE